jgi:hypothetical protein
MIKSSPSRPLDTFEERLLAQLTTVVAERAQDLAGDPATDGAHRPPALRPTWRRRLLPATAAATLVGTGVALGITQLGPGAQPADAVERLADGSVLISVNDASRLGDLPERLKRVGLLARVVPLTTSCRAPALSPIPEGMSVVLFSYPRDASDPVRVHVSGTLPRGQFVVIGVGRIPSAGGELVQMDAGLTAHPPTCLRLRIPASPDPSPSPTYSPPALSTPGG